MLPVWLWPSCPCVTTLLPWSLLCPAFDGCTLSTAIAITTADGSFPQSWNCLGLGLAAGLVSAAAAAAAAASTAAAKLKQHSS